MCFLEGFLEGRLLRLLVETRVLGRVLKERWLVEGAWRALRMGCTRRGSYSARGRVSAF